MTMRQTIIAASIALWAACAQAELEAPEVLGVHVGSYHSAPGFQNVNPGLYAKWANGITIGGYRNSENRNSFYAGYTWQGDYFAVTTGVVTGYKRAAVMPMLVPSVRLPLNEKTAIRLSFIPKVSRGGSHAAHLSVEFKLWQIALILKGGS